MRVGLTGGIGSGKSEVARIFAQLGATIIDADQIARDVVEPGTSAFAAISARWPQVIRNGGIDRAALAAIVFADADQREALNAIVHPAVRARAAEIEREAGDGIAVHVVPLLFEGDYWKECDATIVVTAPVETRIARVQARDGMTRDDVVKRMAAQIDPEIARARATYVIENAGDRSALEAASRAVWSSLRDRNYPKPGQSGR
ncbi:MAG TPA: dephospho-CoA kinase [Candidatus Acidoferrales bacterium]|nr:dephospho-CoA kinase [Candidatus Acidoferrales bacterium]